jgi:16S rRNA (adenine1518-N6/adenine1519-N6)-dimethyltransferase
MAKKRFGQNFLIDETIIDKILSVTHPKPDERFIEIGPGLGALTKPLLASGVKLEVVEIDRDLMDGLKKISKDLIIHRQDALTFDFSSFDKIRVIGNLPYNISSPFLLHCFDYIDNILDMHFMLQKEVVDRLAAQPGSNDYGRLTIIAQYFCHVEKLFVVAPDCFDPVPKVVSAVCRLRPRDDRPAIDVKKLSLITQHAFGQRRKTLRNALRKLFSEQALVETGINHGFRA